MSGKAQFEEVGRINITIPKRVHTAARLHCVEHGVTMAELIVDVLSERLGLDRPKKKPTA